MQIDTMRKRLPSLLLLLLGIVILAALAISHLAKWKIASMLSQEMPDHLELTYTDLAVQPFMGNMKMESISLSMVREEFTDPHDKVKMDELIVEGFGFWSFLFKNEIQLDHLILSNPLALKYLNHDRNVGINVSQGAEKLRTIGIGKLEIQNGSLILHKNPDSVFLTANDVNITLSEVRLDSNHIKAGIPIAYAGIELSAGGLFVDLNPFERLEVKKIEIDRGRMQASELSLFSKHSKIELSNMIKSERDHLSLYVPEIFLDGIDFGFENQNYFLAATICKIRQPKLEIYRDKLVDDNLREKLLCGKMLQKLPIALTIPNLLVTEGQLVYEELVHANSKPGRLFFDDLNVHCTNLSNTQVNGEKTSVTVDASLMGNASMKLDWYFDVNSIDDAFTASGTILELEAESIDPFLEPCVRSRARGYVDEIYFTVSGNSVASKGEMKMKYSDFEVVILKKDGEGINKFLTALGNIFVKRESKADEQGYRYGRIEVERDPAKSFFSYLWVNMRDGLASTMTGSGKRDQESPSR